MDAAQKSIAERRHALIAQWAFPLGLMALLLVLQVLGEPARNALCFDRTLIAQGQLWRLITGSFVHLGGWHTFLNEMGVLVWVLLCPQVLSVRVWLRRMLLLSLSLGVMLYLWAPSLVRYVGMSGVLHGLFVLGLMPQVLKKDFISTACLAYLLGKLGWEFVTGTPVSDEQAIGGHVALESHLFGAIAGVIYGIVFRSFTRIETFRVKELHA